MKRPSNKEIKAAIEQLKSKQSGSARPSEPDAGKPSSKKSSQRIRKQGV